MIELVVRPDFDLRMYRGVLKQWDGERLSNHFEIVSPMGLHAFIGAEGRSVLHGRWPVFHTEPPPKTKQPKRLTAFNEWLETVKPLK